MKSKRLRAEDIRATTPFGRRTLDRQPVGFNIRLGTTSELRLPVYETENVVRLCGPVVPQPTAGDF